MSNKIKNYSKEFIENLCLKHRSKISVAREIGICKITFNSWLQKYGLSMETKRYKESIVLSEIQEQVLIGALLGDGHLALHKIKGKVAGNSQFRYLTSLKDHTQYIASFFTNILTNETKNIKQSSFFDKRTNKTYVRYTMKTIDNIFFTELRKKWYPYGIKVIPPDLKLNSLLCLIWYLGDGDISKSKRSCFIKLSTHCFKISDIKSILLPQLKEFHPVLYHGDKRGQYFIAIPKRYCRLFLNYIGDCPVPSLRYKWDIPPYKNKTWENGQAKNCSQYRQKMVNLFNKGLSYYRVAKILNIGASAVRYHLIQKKLYPRKAKL
jgi:hypothetical protein